MRELKIFIICLFLLKPVISFSQGSIDSKIQNKYPDFDARKQLIIDSMAAWAGDFTMEDFKASDDFEGGKYGAYPIMALYETGQIDKAREFTAQQLVGGAAMFREYSTMALYMEYHHLYGDELREKVKKDQLNSRFINVNAEADDMSVSQSHRNPKIGGASENHKLMYAAAAYLAGLAWPDEYPKAWYQIGYDHLMDWFDLVTSIGFWEEDSPTYLIHHMGPILSVADHAPPRSPMKRKAEMALDWYFASVAGEYLHGYWITASSRDYDPLFGLAHSAETTALMWLAFGDAPFLPGPHELQPFRHWKATLHFAISNYRVPDILRRIATDRDEAFVHRELMMRNPMYPREYNYVAPRYGVASIIGEGDNIPPDMTRWKVQWVADQRDEEPSVFLMKHPKPGEDDWTEWQGASPAEQVIQHEGTLVAVYRMEDDWKPFIDGPVFEDSYEAIRHDDDALYLHAEEVLLAVRAVNGLQFDVGHQDNIVGHRHGVPASSRNVQVPVR